MRLPPLYPILDLELATARGHDLQRCAAEFAAMGLGVQQLRGKSSPAGELLRWAELLRPLVPTLIINDRPDIARLADADGVHLGQDDLPAEAARRLLGAEAWLGFSTHNLEQLESAIADAALPPAGRGYLAVGPVAGTFNKVKPDAVVGVAGVAAARRRYAGPLVAIGGIGAGNCVEVWAAGADSVAVIGGLWNTDDPVAAARLFLLAFARLSCHSPRE